MDIKTITTIVASLVAVIGVSLTIWDSQIKLASLESEEELRKRQVDSLKRELLDERRQQDKEITSAMGTSCRKWEMKLLSSMINQTDGTYDADLLRSMPQDEINSYHQLCKGYRPLLWLHVGFCGTSECLHPESTENKNKLNP